MRRRVQRTQPALRRNGPLLSLRLEPALDVQALLRQAGRLVPSLTLTALVDTGASGTVIQTALLRQLGLAPTRTVFFSTPSTTEPLESLEYRVRLVLADNLAFETDVAEAPMGGQNVQCLIGRDILQQTVFTYNGPRNQFTLTFPQP